jgi:hypothetical protein
MSYKKENPMKRGSSGTKKVENPLKRSSKGRGSEYTGPHSDVSYKDENPYGGKGKKYKKAEGSGNKKGGKGY